MPLPLIDFEKMYIYEIVDIASREALKQLNALDSTTKRSANDIYETICNLYPDFSANIKLNSFKAYLSFYANEDSSPIKRPSDKYGYYLSEVVEEVDEVNSENNIGNGDQNPALSSGELGLVLKKGTYEGKKKTEKSLYPLLVEWLEYKGFSAKNSSDMKGMGKWGNPDITGLKIVDLMYKKEIEIATIEAKFSDKDWKHWFFEAVSHRRFSNRAYFAFAVEEEDISGLLNELQYYSELYSVGVLIIKMKKEEYDKVRREVEPIIDVEKVEIIEYFNAPLSAANFSVQRDFLFALGITSEVALYRWPRK